MGRYQTQTESIRQSFEPSILLALNVSIVILLPEQIESFTQPNPSDSRTEKVPPEYVQDWPGRTVIPTAHASRALDVAVGLVAARAKTRMSAAFNFNILKSVLLARVFESVHPRGQLSTRRAATVNVTIAATAIPAMATPAVMRRQASRASSAAISACRSARVTNSRPWSAAAAWATSTTATAMSSLAPAAVNVFTAACVSKPMQQGTTPASRTVVEGGAAAGRGRTPQGVSHSATISITPEPVMSPKASRHPHMANRQSFQNDAGTSANIGQAEVAITGLLEDRAAPRESDAFDDLPNTVRILDNELSDSTGRCAPSG